MFDGAPMGNYFGRAQVRRTEVEVGLKKLKSIKAAGKDDIVREIRKSGTELRIELVCK